MNDETKAVSASRQLWWLYQLSYTWYEGRIPDTRVVYLIRGTVWWTNQCCGLLITGRLWIVGMRVKRNVRNLHWVALLLNYTMPVVDALLLLVVVHCL